MALVKFFRGNRDNYSQSTHADSVYFAIDTQELLLNGKAYGIKPEDLTKLNGAVDSLAWERSKENADTLYLVATTTDGKTETYNAVPLASSAGSGLMSKSDFDKLTKLAGAVDVEGSVAHSIKTAIDALNVEDTAVVGSYVSAVSEANGKIAVTRAELPTVAEIKSEGQAIIAVKEDKGVISATAGDIAAAHVTIADTKNHFTADTVEAALEELYSQAGAGSKVTIEATDGTDDVLKVYTVKQGGVEVGKINIPKDLVVSSGSVVKGNWVGNVFTESEVGTGTALKLVIANQTAPVYINTLDLVKDHTAGDGINISDTNVVSVVVDPSSEFLSVGADGVKVSGVSAHVATEIGKLNANVTSTSGTFVTVNIVENGGKVEAVTVTENDIAKASDLTTEVARAKAAEDKIEESVGLNEDGTHKTATGNYTSGATTIAGEISALDAQVKKNSDAIDTLKTNSLTGVKVNGVSASVDANVASVTIDGGDITLDGYSVVDNGIIAGTNTVNQAINILENQLVWHEAN